LKKNQKICKFLCSRRFIYILLVILFLGLLFLGTSNWVLYDVTLQIQEKTNLPVNAASVFISNKIFRAMDEINLLRVQKDLLNSELPIYELELSPADLQHINTIALQSSEAGYLKQEINTWRKVSLTVGPKKYKAKLKLHGDLPNHWDDNLKSFKVKMSDDSVNSIRRFNLILFEDRRIAGIIGRILSKQFNLYDIQDDIVVVKVNGVLQGLYYLQERLDTDFFEKNQCSNCILVHTTDNYIQDHPRGSFRDLNGITRDQYHGTAFDNEISNIIIKPSFQNQDVLYAIHNLFITIKKGDEKEIIKYFDIDQISSFEAFRLLTGSRHFVRGDNLRLAYSLSKGKFYPIPRNEEITSLKLENGGFEHNINREIPLFSLLTRNDQVRHIRNKKAYHFIMNNELEKKLDDLTKLYLPYALSYKKNDQSNKYMKYLFHKDIESIKKNIKLIKQNLQYSKAYLNILKKNKKITITLIPDSISQIIFNKLIIHTEEKYKGDVILIAYSPNGEKITLKKNIKKKSNDIDLTNMVQELFFSAGLDDSLYPEARQYILEVIFEEEFNINYVTVKLKNDITGSIINKDDTYIQIANGNNFFNKEKSFLEFKKSYPQFKWEYTDKILTLKQGKYILNKNLIIPSFSQFIIEGGTKISIAEGKSIVSYSPVTIEGSKKKIIIKALELGKPFGTFGFIGDGARSTIIKGLDFSGGSEKTINGIYFSGGLAIHDMDVEIYNTKIHNNYADDGLNVKYGNIVMNDTLFESNFADQFDCDFCTGVIENTIFDKGTSKDTNGDGLDLSGSTVIVKNNIFRNFKDKGVSVGESTRAVMYQNKFINNNIGSANKDKSHSFFIDNLFKNNLIAISSYLKKPIFGGSNSYMYMNVYQDNMQDITKDSNSHNYNINFVDDNLIALEKTIQDNKVQKTFNILEKYQQVFT